MKHESAIIGAIFNEDESLILTYSADGTARLWYTRDGSPAIRPMKSDSPVIAAMFNADFTFPREHLPLCVEAVTGTTLEGISSVRRLTTEDWRERKGLFEKTGLKKRIVMKTRSVAQR